MNGREVAAVRGVVTSVLGMINRGTTHVGVATDEQEQRSICLGGAPGAGQQRSGRAGQLAGALRIVEHHGSCTALMATVRSISRSAPAGVRRVVDSPGRRSTTQRNPSVSVSPLLR